MTYHSGNDVQFCAEFMNINVILKYRASTHLETPFLYSWLCPWSKHLFIKKCGESGGTLSSSSQWLQLHAPCVCRLLGMYNALLRSEQYYCDEHYSMEEVEWVIEHNWMSDNTQHLDWGPSSTIQKYDLYTDLHWMNTTVGWDLHCSRLLSLKVWTPCAVALCIKLRHSFNA